MRSAFLTLLLLLPLYVSAADENAAKAANSSNATDANNSSADADIPPPPIRDTVKASNSSNATDAANSSSNADIPPPPAATNNPSDTQPKITIKHKGSSRIEEYRMNGRLYMIRIIPAEGKPYYLVDPKGDGQFVRQDIMNGGLRPPMWVLHQW
uniref:DUF2782 domain-containing protein n=1 Tax=mine drainage metagenome TaxID=410659 RepID=E6QQY3_9ZZZZ